jgi:hypothetical protein
MGTKDKNLNIRISAVQKKKIEDDAKKYGVGVPKYVLNAADFYSGFDVHFLEHIKSTAQKVKLPMATVMQQLLVAYVHADTAIMEVFGTGGKTYQRAFQYDENGLIEGTKHADMVYDQVKNEISILREKLENAVKSRKAVVITGDDAAIMAARL